MTDLNWKAKLTCCIHSLHIEGYALCFFLHVVSDSKSQIPHGFKKTPPDYKTSQIFADCKNSSLDLVTWILCLSTLPPDSWSLIYKQNVILKEDFRQVSPILFPSSLGKALLTLFLIQESDTMLSSHIYLCVMGLTLAPVSAF